VIVTSMKKGGVASFYGLGRFYVGRRAQRRLPAHRTANAVGRAVHQIGRQRGKMLLRQESAWI